MTGPVEVAESLSAHSVRELLCPLDSQLRDLVERLMVSLVRRYFYFLKYICLVKFLTVASFLKVSDT